MESADFHDQAIRIDNPPQFAPGSAIVILDVTGRLLGLEVIPTTPEEGGPPAPEAPESTDWSTLLAAAGLDPSRLTPAAPPELPPTYCDATAAWTGTLPDAPDMPVTFQAGAFRGQPVYFTVVSETGSTTGPISETEEVPVAFQWVGLFILAIGPLCAAIVLARRNLKLGRGDRRGATRVAMFLLLSFLGSDALTLRLSEGIWAALATLSFGPLLGHALVHAVALWFYYMALEPYVRRLWPRMLVSWARVLSGRLRDPLVGRDILIGGLMASGTMIGTSLAFRGLIAAGAVSLPDVVTREALYGLTNLKGIVRMAAGEAGGSLLQVMVILVIVFLVHLLVKRIWVSAVIAGMATGAFPFATLSADFGPLVSAVFMGLFMTMALVSLFRFGLLPALVSVFSFFFLLSTPFTHDLSSWYAPNMLLSLAILLGLYGYGFYTSLAGQPIFRDLLQESRTPAS
jgi:hypothetical protein